MTIQQTTPVGTETMPSTRVDVLDGIGAATPLNPRPPDSVCGGKLLLDGADTVQTRDRRPDAYLMKEPAHA